MPYILDISKGSVYEAKIIKDIKNENYIKQIKDFRNITLITALTEICKFF